MAALASGNLYEDLYEDLYGRPVDAGYAQILCSEALEPRFMASHATDRIRARLRYPGQSNIESMLLKNLTIETN